MRRLQSIRTGSRRSIPVHQKAMAPEKIARTSTISGLVQFRTARCSRGDHPLPKDNRYSLDIATLAIFPEYVEFDGEEVLKLVVQGEAGRTIK